MATTTMPITSAGVPARGAQTGAVASLPTTGATPAATASTRNPTSFSSTPVPSTGTNFASTSAALTDIINQPASQFSGQAGSIISGATRDAVTAITDFAQQRMEQVQQNIQALLNSEGGELNAAKLQVYSNQLQNYTTMMELAAKMQEKRDRAVEIWVRP